MKIHIIFFSPNGATYKLATSIEKTISNIFSENNLPLEAILSKNITLSANRKELPRFSKEDFVIFALPVYAGRVPNFLLPFLHSLNGKGISCSTLCVYGNRAYDDSLIELNHILLEGGFNVISSAAFIGNHCFSKKIAFNRPDDKDLALAWEFMERTINKLILMQQYTLEPAFSPPKVSGYYPPKNYYTPRDSFGNSVSLKNVKPEVLTTCKSCGLCSTLCPVDNISSTDSKESRTYCIKCNACINSCPTNSRYFKDLAYLQHKEELEMALSFRREPEFFF